MRKGIIFYCINTFLICFLHHSGIHYFELSINRISEQRRQVLRDGDNYGADSLFMMIILRIFLFNQSNTNWIIKQFRTSSLHKKEIVTCDTLSIVRVDLFKQKWIYLLCVFKINIFLLRDIC